MRFSVATWNINSVRRRLDIIARFVDEHDPDVLCLQETKCDDQSFPHEALAAMGFSHMEWHGQKAYHGIATLSKLPMTRGETLDFNGTGEPRHLAVNLDMGKRRKPVTIHNFYVPAGGDEPDVNANPKFRHKLDFLTGMSQWKNETGGRGKPRMVLVGDLNVAPLETDVWSHKQLLKVVSHTPIEVEHLARAQDALDWVDVVRSHVPPEEKLFTWWSYRSRNWRASNRGRRLDHIWATPNLASKSTALKVVQQTRDWPQTSDHVPVLATFDLSDG